MYVDRKLQELSMTTRMPMQDVSVLTAVTIADEMLKAQDEIRRLRGELSQARDEIEAIRLELEAE